MTILKKLCVASRKYKGSDGKEKTVWKTVGHLHQTNDGTRQYITLDPSVNLAAFPIKDGDDRVYCNLFSPDEEGAGAGNPRRPAAAPAPTAQKQTDDLGDDLPF